MNYKLKKNNKQLECQLQQKAAECTSLINEDTIPKTHHDTTDNHVTDVFHGKTCV